MPETTPSRPLDRLADQIAQKARSGGFVTVLTDTAGRVHVVPEAAEVVGVYGSGIRKSHILDDLDHAGARR